MKLYQFIIFVIIVFLIASSVKDRLPKTVVFYNNGDKVVEIKAEIAKDIKKGLMGREELLADAGMLFSFSSEQKRSFWMKNTLIPLDLIFLDKDKNIILIIKDLEPCLTDPCPSYGSSEDSQYVIEVNAGFTKEFNITKNTKVEF